MMKKHLLFIFALICLVISQIEAQTNKGFDSNYNLKKFEQFYYLLDHYYIENLNSEKLVEDAIKTMLADLDPHSAYVSEQEMIDVKTMFDGKFAGIGIEFNILRDTLFVVNTVSGGASEKVGVLPNDRIVKIDEKSAIGITQTEVPKLLRGEKGTSVTIEVVRKGVSKELKFRIIRGDIPIHAVDAAYIIEKNIGYIRINKFAANTMKELTEYYKRLGKIDGLIIDLRGNGGGMMEQAVEMGDFFLEKGEKIVSTQGNKTKGQEYIATGTGLYKSGKLVILIDEFSASASEIVAGAIQDWDRGIIIGRRSFGKGLVQNQMPLMDGSAVRITTAKYLTPTGRAIQRPFENGKQEEYYKSFAERMTREDSLKIDEFSRFKTLKKGRDVFGGGGIYPDIYVAADTSAHSNYLSQLVQNGVIMDFVHTYLDNNRSEIKSQFSSFEKFQANYFVSEKMLSELSDLGVSRGVVADVEGMNRSRKQIQLQIKALLAQKMWGVNEYFIVINSGSDPIIKNAIRVIKNWDIEAKQIL